MREAELHLERMVRAPIDAVFDKLADIESINEWQPHKGSIRRGSRKTSDGPVGLGTTYENTSQFMGRTVDLSYETITFQRPTRLQFRGRNKQSTATDSMTFTPTADGGTSIHYRADFTFHGVLKHLAPLVVRRKIDDVADDTVARIATTLAAR